MCSSDLTGRAFSDFHREHQARAARYPAWRVLLAPSPELLNARIEARALHMAPALLAEVRALLAAGLPVSAPALQALGYRQAVERVLRGQDGQGLEVELAQSHRHYAKRQLTWFRSEINDLCVQTADAPDVTDALEIGRAHV